MSLLLRVLALVSFVLLVILVVAKADGGTLETVLLPLGLAFWVASTLVTDIPRSTP